MKFSCCCRNFRKIKKDSLLKTKIYKKNYGNLSLSDSDSDSNLSYYSTDKISTDKISDNDSTGTVSECSNSSLNDYIIALDLVMTRQQYMNPQSPELCNHQIEKLIFNTNLL